MNAGEAVERIPPLAPPYGPELDAALASVVPPPLPPLRLYRQVAQNGALFRRLVEGGLLGRRGLLWLGQMSSDLRELIILRTTARMRAGYEWEVHVAFFGRNSGLTQTQINATCRAALDSNQWTKRQYLALQLIDACVSGTSIDDELWKELSAQFDDGEIIEAISLSGMYRTVSTVATILGTASEPGVPAFPGWEDQP